MDQDLGEIFEKFIQFKNGELENSEYCFFVNRSEIGSDFKFNPQAFMPTLNKTLKQIANMDSKAGWSVTPIGQMITGIKIFKGPRLRTDNIIVPGPGEEGNIVPYYTPSAILQEKADSVKYLNLDKANRKQRKDFEIVRLFRGDIVVTRSGSIGRVSMITKQFDNVIASDDMIRVRIPNEYLRHYVYCYLQSKAAIDQMMRNEYGSIQQHLEPEHISKLLIPIPDDIEQLRSIVEASMISFDEKEKSFDALQSSLASVKSLLSPHMD